MQRNDKNTYSSKRNHCFSSLFLPLAAGCMNKKDETNLRSPVQQHNITRREKNEQSVSQKISEIKVEGICKSDFKVFQPKQLQNFTHFFKVKTAACKLKRSLSAKYSF